MGKGRMREIVRGGMQRSPMETYLSSLIMKEMQIK